MFELFGLIFCLSATSKCFDTETANIIFADKAKTEKTRHKKFIKAKYFGTKMMLKYII
jgi:hypothetical protein